MGKSKSNGKAIIIVLAATVFTAAGQLFFKMASGLMTESIFSLLINTYFWIGIFIYGIGAVLLMKSLTIGDLTAVYPVFAMSYVWVALVSLFILGEAISTMDTAGILFIVLGVSVMGVSGNG